MEIKNVLTNDELETRFNALCEKNWKIRGMAKGLNFDTAKEKIDNWFSASRTQLLKLLNIREDKDYKFVYHENI